MARWTGGQKNECQQVLSMFLERVQFLHEIQQINYLFEGPKAFDEKLIRKKWKPETAGYLTDLADGAPRHRISPFESGHGRDMSSRRSWRQRNELGFGAVLLPFRLVLTGTGGGPSMFDFSAFLGKAETLDAPASRSNAALS